MAAMKTICIEKFSKFVLHIYTIYRLVAAFYLSVSISPITEFPGMVASYFVTQVCFLWTNNSNIKNITFICTFSRGISDS